MLLSPYHAGGQRPPAQVLRNSLPGHSRLAAISASWLVSSKVAPPVARMPSKGSLALILPTSWAPSYRAADGHAFRPAPDVPGSLLHGDLMLQTKWCKYRRFFTPFISFISFGVKNGTFLHQIPDSDITRREIPCYASGRRRNSDRELRST